MTGINLLRMHSVLFYRKHEHEIRSLLSLLFFKLFFKTNLMCWREKMRAKIIKKPETSFCFFSLCFLTYCSLLWFSTSWQITHQGKQVACKTLRIFFNMSLCLTVYLGVLSHTIKACLFVFFPIHLNLYQDYIKKYFTICTHTYIYLASLIFLPW